jgi:hypothetical protein
MKTRLLLPNNIFSKILLSELSATENYQVDFLPSALIAKNLAADENAVGLIPTLDLLSFKDLFVSSEIGISFNALLSNSYIHFKEGQETIKNIFLTGDVTSNEIILSKILFKEFYDVDVTPSLVKDENAIIDDNILIIGDENYNKELFLNGLSFSEEIIELIDSPYVNFLFASSSEQILKQFSNAHRNDFLDGHKDEFNDILKDFPATSLEFINVNMQHVVFDFEEQDLEGVKSLMQLPYFHGMIKDMIDIKFV